MAGINLNKNYGVFRSRAWVRGVCAGIATILMYQ